MGTYIYGLTKRTKKDPVYGDVHILNFLHKPCAWGANERWIRAEERREQGYRDRWFGETIPKYVCFDGTGRTKDGRLTTVMEYRGGALWNDNNEHLMTYVRMDGVDVTPPIPASTTA